jgi:hypothetical protein
MIMGESAGTAAAMALLSKRPVQKVDLYELQEKLKGYNQVLSLKGNPYGIWNNEKEIVIDNNMKGFTFFTGNWAEEETVHTGRFEMNFRVKPKGQMGEFQYVPYLFKTGTYKVSMWYPSASDYEAKVPVTIHHSKGEKQIVVNQQKNGGKWVNLGEFIFEEGHKLAITIHGEKDKYVIADAVKFELVK